MQHEQIIVPLDVRDLESAIALVELLPQVTWWKVGLQLFVSVGPAILDYLQEKQKRVFLDLKFHDIPNTIAGACRSAGKYGVELLTLHGVAGKRALQAAKDSLAGISKPPKLIAITLLTSLSSRELAFELKIPLELPEYALNIALLAQEAGLDGAVCSPQEASKLREVCGDNFLLVCPGIRPSWSTPGDQKRTMTPKQAFQAGANYLVIGRPITAEDNPQQAWEKVVQECGSN